MTLAYSVRVELGALVMGTCKLVTGGRIARVIRQVEPERHSLERDGPSPRRLRGGGYQEEGEVRCGRGEGHRMLRKGWRECGRGRERVACLVRLVDLSEHREDAFPRHEPLRDCLEVLQVGPLALVPPRRPVGRPREDVQVDRALAEIVGHGEIEIYAHADGGKRGGQSDPNGQRRE